VSVARAGAALAAIVTVPPYAPFVGEVAKHPLVRGLRLNTVMPLKGPPGGIDEKLAVLERLGGFDVPLWVDLKGRQLRVVGAAIPPFTEVRLSHRIRLPTPADAFFGDGREHARVIAAEGDRLILEDGPRRLVGPGESVNIVHDGLEVEGTLTPTDLGYLEAMRKLGLGHVLLSFVERPEDAAEVREHLPGAEVGLKVESRRGLEFARRHGAAHGRLVAARGDLYVEVGRPHAVIGAVRAVIAADPEAMVGSRLFPSLARHPVPEATDLGDAAFLVALGYRTFVLGDEVCLRRDSAIAALNLLEAVGREMA
jgi:pyruvate kinase